MIRREGRRQDGRDVNTVRPIASEGGLLPRAHGSSLFTRGETQAIAVATLGGKVDAQRTDGIGDSEDRRFYLHYFFPPSSVGETGRIGAANRREVGHGNLAERALAPIIPPEEQFPFTVRLESTITESNGSSSMASVCAGCLALQDAGVPISRCAKKRFFPNVSRDAFCAFFRAARFFEKHEPEARSLRTLSVAVRYGERSSHNRARTRADGRAERERRGTRVETAAPRRAAAVDFVFFPPPVRAISGFALSSEKRLRRDFATVLRRDFATRLSPRLSPTTGKSPASRWV